MSENFTVWKQQARVTKGNTDPASAINDVRDNLIQKATEKVHRSNPKLQYFTPHSLLLSMSIYQFSRYLFCT